MKNIDERVKNQIVDLQISYLKEKQPNELVNYETLRNYLSEAIRESFPEDVLNQEPDYDLLDEMDKIETKNWKGEDIRYQAGRRARLINSIQRESKDYKWGDVITHKDFVEFYKIAQSGKVRDYGAKTHQLLKDYLAKKNLI